MFHGTRGTTALNLAASCASTFPRSNLLSWPGGDYDYSDLDLFLRDQSPDQLGERSTGNSNYYGDQIGFYWFANDNWKVRRNLSLNLGLRYEYTTVPFTERLQTLNQIANAPGVMTFGEPHDPKNAFAPRVGFAYTPGSNDKTVVRGGISMGYDVLYDNIGVLSLPPEFGSTIDVDVTNQTPNFLANGGIHPGGLGTYNLYNSVDRQLLR